MTEFDRLLSDIDELLWTLNNSVYDQTKHKSSLIKTNLKVMFHEDTFDNRKKARILKQRFAAIQTAVTRLDDLLRW